MASKTLMRTGASLMNRFLSKPLLHPNPNSNHQIVSHALEITPKLFPSLSNLDTSLRFPQNDTESITRVFNESFVHPCRLPYLPLILPEGDESSSNEPMILFPKQTFQPSTIRRKRNHGFFCSQGNQGWTESNCSKNSKGSCTNYSLASLTQPSLH